MERTYFVNLDSTLEVTLDLPEDVATQVEFDQVRDAFIHELRRLLLDPNIKSSDFDVTITDDA